ncbi:MAG: TetR/AcrR family transcriptional regulator [Rhodococcus fascians]|jgi:AcrR family transcriptional regulator|uniref:TetR/AcrR family transcriptional regulator n=1 Tax=Nocardiaceae TaxID=85025 RepID=UPI000522F843|nr:MULTISPECIES: TetR/AcrR family transcriptional regulator [Rhodococcus]OZD11764.1 TetR/AcrR family transcriptional regulator [Rhodococcus sp. 06-156-4C]OZD15608.1 TetR/AcrR family transcriptional regulator [Rhodococcus sp. 06-156-4a]OZD23774.1 TetR/AcrR family transcriptional regulator [Rhodococcus sp. 06-156-3C]OZD27154.1 TetR/AcrR family transcriptional regulator [Rhodococcus sp. 06-156-3b]OZD31451.1 TetR/AcrR family transcriptional regulator [Rhodococcus sp. 06-156-3]
MPYRRTSAVQARIDAGREKLFDAAVEVLSSQGYRGLSIASVAAAAGVSAGSVYTHFDSKSDLVVAIFRTVCGREVQAVVDAAGASGARGMSNSGASGARGMSRTGSGSVVERVTAIVETFAGRAMKNRTMAYALLAEPVDPAVDAERLVFRRSFAAAIGDAVADGIAAGDIPEQNVEIAAAALVGAVGEVLVGPLSPDRTDTADVIPDLVAFALRSLGVS